MASAPDMDGCPNAGYEQHQRCKNDPGGGRGPVSETRTVIIALTASVLEEKRSEVPEAGCDDFLLKPFRDSDLFEMMRKHLGVRFVYEAKSEASGKAAPWESGSGC